MSCIANIDLKHCKYEPAQALWGKKKSVITTFYKLVITSTPRDTPSHVAISLFIELMPLELDCPILSAEVKQCFMQLQLMHSLFFSKLKRCVHTNRLSPCNRGTMVPWYNIAT